MEKEIMRTTNLTPKTSARPRLIWMVALAVSALLTLGYARLSFGQRSEPKTFSSPGEASNALFQAVKNEDEQALEAILGAGKEVIPFHGSYVRVVVVSWPGKTMRGLKLMAYPKGYQSSGVKTFVVTQRGSVFEKDLGPETPTVAPQMKARTGPSWHTTE